MIRKATKMAVLSAVGLSAALAAQSASAVLITEWNYNVDSTFSDFTSKPSDTNGNTGAVVGSGSNAVLGGNTTLRWGANNGTPETTDDGSTSSISITSDVDSPPAARLVTNGGAQPGAIFTHNNQAISTDFAILDTFGITTQLMLQSAVPTTGTDTTLAPIVFDSFFTETLNQATVDDCVAGSTSACDDIFVLTNTNTGGTLQVPTQSFTIDDFTYTVALNVGGVNPLTDDQCDAAGAAAGCVGFLTQENNNNRFTSSFSISAVQNVPEPATLAMLAVGLVLIGGGLYSRRRNLMG